MIKAIMHGCNGKMGQVISHIIEEDDAMELVAGIDLFDGIQNSYPVFKSIKECGIKGDVVIDFANPAAVKELLEYCINTRTPLVQCTTGLNEEQKDLVKKASESIPVLNSANMSLGVNTLFSILKEVTKILAPAGYDIEIVEKHHNQKIDAPSGTAKLLYEVIEEEIGETTPIYDRSALHEKRTHDQVGIQAMRGGTIFGEHTVMFAGIDEIIEIKHTALSKEVFVQGAISAAYALNDKEKGLYTLKTLY